MRILLCALVVGSGVGAALEVPHLAFLASEPVEVRAPGPEPPALYWSGELFTPTWEKVLQDESTLFRAWLPPEALGVWTVCDRGACFAFVRVSAELALVEVHSAPGSALTLGDHTRVADARGRAFFAVPPGRYVLQAEFQGWTLARPLELSRGQHESVVLVYAEVVPTTPLVLPGWVFSLQLCLVAPAEFPSLQAEVLLPAGWDAEVAPGFYDPVPVGVLSSRTWWIAIPSEAAEGVYVLEAVLPDLNLRAQASVIVTRFLPARTVVGHWDVRADRLDLTQPFQLTFERLLWAQTYVGRMLPHTNRIFTRADFEALAREWEQAP